MVRHLTRPKATYPGKIQESKAPASAPDFQVEAEEDIKTETNGIWQDLLLALSKVRPGLGGKSLGTGQSRELCYPVSRVSSQRPGSGQNCPYMKPPENSVSA